MSILELTHQLNEAKAGETEAKAKRIAIEEQLAAEIGLPEQWEGSKTNEVGAGIKLTVKRAMNIKIDEKALTDIARTEELTDWLPRLFRWKPELDKKNWNVADETIKAAFAGAMTVTPGKPSFSVKIEEEAV